MQFQIKRSQNFNIKVSIKNITEHVLENKTKEQFTKDVRLTPGEGGLRNPDVQLLFECDSIVLSGRRGEGV